MSSPFRHRGRRSRAGDDNEALLLVIAACPLGRLPFPVESVIRTGGTR